MLLDYKLVPDRSQEKNIIWITKKNLILGIFTSQNFISLRLKCNYNIILNNQTSRICC